MNINKGKVLVAEDDAINQQVFYRILTKFGYEVTIASNGAEARESACEKQFDLIFMDCRMPIMSGVDASRAIRQESLNISTPIIAITGQIITENDTEYSAAGINDYLCKPIRIHEMTEMIDKWLPVSASQLP